MVHASSRPAATPRSTPASRTYNGTCEIFWQRYASFYLFFFPPFIFFSIYYYILFNFFFFSFKRQNAHKQSHRPRQQHDDGIVGRLLSRASRPEIRCEKRIQKKKKNHDDGRTVLLTNFCTPRRPNRYNNIIFCVFFSGSEKLITGHLQHSARNIYTLHLCDGLYISFIFFFFYWLFGRREIFSKKKKRVAVITPRRRLLLIWRPPPPCYVYYIIIMPIDHHVM